ncbi:MAG: cell envelope integrity protein TolA [Pseudomonadota bacterium]
MMNRDANANYGRSALFSLGVHGALVICLGLSSHARAQDTIVPRTVAQAVQPSESAPHVLVAAVSETDLNAEVARIEAAERAKKDQAQQKIDQLKQEAKQAKEAQSEREKQLKKLSQEVENLKQAVQQKQQEAKSAKLQAQKNEENLKRFQEQANQHKQQAELLAQAEQKRRQDAEQALQNLMAEEQQGRIIQEEIALALGKIQARVSQAWLRPIGMPAALECQLAVQLLPTGDVVKAKVVVSSGHVSFDRAAEAAVLKASPLPMPENSRARQQLKDFTFVFKPEA